VSAGADRPALEALAVLLLWLDEHALIAARICHPLDDRPDQDAEVLLVVDVAEDELSVEWSGQVYTWHGGPDDGAQAGRTAAQAGRQIARLVNRAKAAMIGEPVFGAAPGNALPLRVDVEILGNALYEEYTGAAGPTDLLPDLVARHGAEHIANCLIGKIRGLVERLVDERGMTAARELIDAHFDLLFPNRSGRLYDLVYEQLRKEEAATVPAEHRGDHVLKLAMLHAMLLHEVLNPPPDLRKQ
jgi:hypothetical protein